MVFGSYSTMYSILCTYYHNHTMNTCCTVGSFKPWNKIGDVPKCTHTIHLGSMYYTMLGCQDSFYKGIVPVHIDRLVPHSSTEINQNTSISKQHIENTRSLNGAFDLCSF